MLKAREECDGKVRRRQERGSREENMYFFLSLYSCILKSREETRRYDKREKRRGEERGQ